MEKRQDNYLKILYERKNNSYYEVEKKEKPSNLVFWESEDISPYSKIHTELNERKNENENKTYY